MKGLSPKQKQVLEILESAVREGQHLTVREIGDRIGVSSTCTVHQHLKALERKGYLKPTNHRHRAIELTAPPRPFIKVPYRGPAAAGAESKAAPFGAESMLFPTELVGLGESVLFQARGDDMSQSAICDGDLLVVRPEEQANSGDVVVATVQGNTVLKRLARDNGTIRLESGLSQEPPIVPEDGSLIVGRVAMVIRNL